MAAFLELEKCWFQYHRNWTMIRNWQMRGMKNMVILIDMNIALDFLTMRQPYYNDARDIILDLEFNDSFKLSIGGKRYERKIS